ncbi:MAG: chromosome partitioning protein [Solibacterales bacterium]|nr:chromosome partitioning protein [Bryobacterales bacterium]|tara:strand:+ start:8890 stop:9975 length:1086 start_codon:yes stop_codon:yes gene_type:complete
MNDSQINQEQILDALRVVIDPDLHRDIVALGFVKELKVRNNRVSFHLELTTPACPVKDELREQAEDAVRKLPGIEAVEVTLSAQVRSHGPTGQNIIPGIKNVIPVGSGKGGVGKSTVSANLAVALAETGASVGLMDADVYGPSIPTILGINDQPRSGGKGMLPVEAHGVKVISAGFFVKPDQAVVWRGPMLAKMIEQFLGQVEWGELDYLVVDLPPGTGDVQLTLCQRIPLTGALIVTTPQPVAVNIAEKAIIMFNQLKCPLLGVVENMSYWESRTTGEREFIFGSGGADRIAEKWEVPVLGKIPLATTVRESSDSGTPIVLDEAGSPAAVAFVDTAKSLAAQISIRNIRAESEGLVSINF